MPDLATRRLVHELHAQLGLPIYLLVDGDPAGLHIMCTYRYGSQVWALSNHKLAVTSARWLGVLPRDCTRLWGRRAVIQ